MDRRHTDDMRKSDTKAICFALYGMGILMVFDNWFMVCIGLTCFGVSLFWTLGY